MPRCATWRRGSASCRCQPRWPQTYLDKTAEVVPIFDRQLGRHRFLAGEVLTAADLFLYPIYAYFPDIAELRAIADKAPSCDRWAREMAARPSVRANAQPAFKPQIAA